MGTSIRCGIDALTSGPGGAEISAVVLTVCDQPYFSADTIRQLIAAQQQSGCVIAAATYEGTRGVPALFSRSLLPELMTLAGQEGARRVILAHADETVGVPFPE